jgi:hypothetical protein
MGGINKSMKTLIIIPAILLTACSFIMPVPHDPAEAAKLIDIKQKVETLTCGATKDLPRWQSTVDDMRWLNMYTEFRQDPQAKTIEELYIATQKARDGSIPYCEATLKLQKTRIQVIEKAWKGR